jgi:hypothetical protein
MMRARRTVRGLLLLVALAAPASAQLIPIPVRRPRTGERPARQRFPYGRPVISPWAGGDFGLAITVAQCEECVSTLGGAGFMGTIAAGATLFSRITIAAERSGTSVFIGNSRNHGQLTMATIRMGTPTGLHGKFGYGKGWYKLDPTVLVDSRRAWTVGTELCRLSRVDGCTFADFSESDVGAAQHYDTQMVHYRMRVIRLGTTVRFHLLRGEPNPLPK